MPFNNKLVAQIRAEVLYGIDLLVDRELVIDTNNVVVGEAAGRYTITWGPHARLAYLFGTYTSLNQYIALVLNRDYTALLVDGSALQIHYAVEGDEIISHRLCYFPCPFIVDPAEIDDYGLTEIPDLLSDKEFKSRLKLVTPIRFDFDLSLQDDIHYHSHVTAGKDSCRIPAFGPLSVGHFLYFVLGYFYQEHFPTDDAFEDLEPTLLGRTLNNPPGHRLFFDTAIRPAGAAMDPVVDNDED